MTMATVHATAPSENWDDDFEFNALSRTNTTTKNDVLMIHDQNAHRVSIASSDWDHDDNDDHKNTKTNMILEDRTNTLNLSSDWIEPGPSTPRKTNNAENWDDDFEDSPVRKAFPSSPGKDKASPLRLRRKQPQQPRPESWDDEFEAEEANALHSDDDMGYVDRDEEDRTVTARPRRSPARLSNSPPPVPALPLPFLLPSSASGPSPFPRSPTSSVFSVPTARPPSSAFTVTSTTHLRPTASRSSGGFDAFPPSPPIHRERERRRLRKKSRPQGNTIELAVIRGERDEYDFREESEGDIRPTTPPPVAQSTPATPSSSGGAGALLSRIGSMKKWGVRRRKGSTAPSETEDRDRITPRPARPQSQASISSISSSTSSHHQHREHPVVPPASSSGKRSSTVGPSPSWFFRSASSPFSRGSASELDLCVQPQTPTKNRHPKPDEATPAKLVKRKSLGFVQLKRGFNGVGGHGDNVNERRSEKSRERMGEKYGAVGLGRATEIGKEGSVPPDEKHVVEEKEKDGSRSFMGSVRRLSLAGRHKRTKSGVSLQNVVGRLDVGLGTGLRDENITPTPESVAARNTTNVTPVTPSKSPTPKPVPSQLLLPPIELQPPSPPRVRPAAPGPDNAKSRVPEPTFSPSGSLPTVTSNASLSSPTPSTSTSVSASRRHLPSIGSPQSASLGRSSIGPEAVIANTVGLRRSSLGDLKIPERISQAQVGLRKDIERVREFAAGVEKLKALQATYEKLVTQVQYILDQQHQQQQQQQLERQQQLEKQQHVERQSTRPSTPSFFANISRPLSRNRSVSRNRSNTTPAPPPSASTASLAHSFAFAPPPSSAAVIPTVNAYKQLASAYYTIRSKYRISWECAELLIELGSGSNAPERGPTSSVSVPAMPLPSVHKTARERAITLNGEDSKPPTPVPGQGPPASASSPGIGVGGKAGWRASTGKHDLSQRQLVLLKEILSGGDGSAAEEVSIPEEGTGIGIVNREWRWGKDGMSSTLTLPSEDNSSAVGEAAGGEVTEKGKLKKKRGASRLRISGLRDILKSFKRSQDQEDSNSNGKAPTPPPSVPASTTSLSTTDDSMDSSHFYPHRRVSPSYGRRRPQTSSGPGESSRVGRPASPYCPSLHSKPSPRRPSLASIFRIGRGSKPTSPEVPPGSHTSSRSASRQDSSTGEEEDWDRMDDAEDEIVLGKADQDASATVRVKKKARGPGRSPYLQDGYPSLPSLPGRTLTPKRSVSGSQSSIWGEETTRSTSNGSGHGGHGRGTTPPLSRVTKLSNVEEDTKLGDVSQHHYHYHRPPPRVSSRSSFTRPPTMKSGSVRSMPPHPVINGLPDPTLAMTPENIRPLLENARGVQVKLVDCIAEVKALLETYPQS